MNIEAILPMCPSLNNAYPTNRQTGKRYRSKEYQAWLKLADSGLWNQKRYKVTGKERFNASFKFYATWLNKDGSIKKTDISNYYKVSEDYIKNFVVGFDDKQIFSHNGSEKIHSDRDEIEIVITEII